MCTQAASVILGKTCSTELKTSLNKIGPYQSQASPLRTEEKLIENKSSITQTLNLNYVSMKYNFCGGQKAFV